MDATTTTTTETCLISQVLPSPPPSPQISEAKLTAQNAEKVVEKTADFAHLIGVRAIAAAANGGGESNADQSLKKDSFGELKGEKNKQKQKQAEKVKCTVC